MTALNSALSSMHQSLTLAHATEAEVKLFAKRVCKAATELRGKPTDGQKRVSLMKMFEPIETTKANNSASVADNIEPTAFAGNPSIGNAEKWNNYRQHCPSWLFEQMRWTHGDGEQPAVLQYDFCQPLDDRKSAKFHYHDDKGGVHILLISPQRERRLVNIKVDDGKLETIDLLRDCPGTDACSKRDRANIAIVKQLLESAAVERTSTTSSESRSQRPVKFAAGRVRSLLT